MPLDLVREPELGDDAAALPLRRASESPSRRTDVTTDEAERVGHLGVTHGAALYVGSLVGPGVLLVPALAVQAGGAASVELSSL